MSTEALQYMITIQQNFDKATASFNKFKNEVNTGVDKIQKSLNSIKLNSLIQNINSAAQGLDSLNEPGMKLSTNMYDLQAITGVAGEKLKQIEGYARENAKTFGGDASASAESYKLILSQLTPEIAKVPKALKSMGNEVSVTSKLMGGDTVAATNVLTTAMNQYQVSLKNPIKASQEMARMNNVMAAAAKEGSAELPQIAQALEQSGLAAKTANVSFEETNAFIQVLDKNGKKGAEGGVALRNVMATLAQGRFLPKDVKKELESAGVDINKLTDNSISLAERLKPLRSIMNDQALITKLFGKENSNAAIAMISGIDNAEELTLAITGTNTAYEQAAIIMESPLEKNKRLQAQIDDFKISVFNSTNGLLGYANVIGQTANDFSNLLPIITGAESAVKFLTNAEKMNALWRKISSNVTKVAIFTTGLFSTVVGLLTGQITIAALTTAIWTKVQAGFNAVMAMNPIVLVVLAVIALVAAIVWVASKTEGWGKLWQHTVNGAKLLFQAYVEVSKAQFNTLVNGIMIGINKIQIGWYKFKNMVGMGDKNQNQAMINQLNNDVEKRKESIKAGYKKAADTALKARDEFAKGIDSVKWKKEKKGEESADGISAPGIPGMQQPGMKQNSDGSDKVKKSNEAVATGGTKHNYITINLKDLIGVLNISGKDFNDSTNQMTSQTEDALLRLLAMASSTAS